jgi:hypothetical protein
LRRNLRCIAALLGIAQFHSPALACGPLAASAVFVVEGSQGRDQTQLAAFPLGKWNARTRLLEPFSPEIQAPDIEWMPKELYSGCEYRLFDSRGRFVRVIQIDRWLADAEDRGYYLLPGITNMAADGERYLATNVPTVRESNWMPIELTHRQHIEAAKRVIPEYLKTQRARGDGDDRPGPGDFMISSYQKGDVVKSWWVNSDAQATALVEFGSSISLQTFSTNYADPLSVINYADEAPRLVVDLDGDGESEFLFSVAHDKGGGFVFLMQREGRWEVTTETRIAGG